MNIAIIGAGWVGCHLAKNLKNAHTIKLFDKTGIFAETSFRNQNRLHMGFHYPRNFNTRKLCHETFNKFINEYPSIVSDVKNNIYAIPKDKSIIDFETYKSILSYEKINFKNFNLKNIKNIEGAIVCDEKLIKHKNAKEYFNNELGNIFEKIEFSQDCLLKISKEFDIVINCTNNLLKDITEKSYYELCLVLLYKKKRGTNIGALTLMDGKFFSIYPYQNDIYTITDVEYTPIYKSENINFDYNINLKQRIDKIEDKIKYHYSDFKLDFEYMDYFLSLKTKKYNESGDRYPVITRKNNIINCYTGKIQGIYLIEDFIRESINR